MLMVCLSISVKTLFGGVRGRLLPVKLNRNSIFFFCYMSEIMSMVNTSPIYLSKYIFVLNKYIVANILQFNYIIILST